MKVQQIVGEHKKGFRAKKYARKPTNTIAPKKPEAIKPQGAVAPGEDKKKINEAPGDAELFAQVDALMKSNPQFAAEVKSRQLSLVRGIGPDAQRHNAQVMQQYRELVQKYSGGVKETAPGAVVGKIAAVNQAQGTANITGPDGSTKTVDVSQLKPGENNTVTLNTPDIQPGTTVNAEKNMEEAPETPYYVDNSSGTPMAKTGGRGPTQIVASTKWQVVTPEIEKAIISQGFRKVTLQFNNKQFAGYEGGDQKLGSKIIVSPADFQALSARPAQESKELDDIRKLSGL